jgi:hypothetical protein
MDIQADLSPEKKEQLETFVAFAIEDIGIQSAPEIIIQATRDGLETTAAYSPYYKRINVYGGSRAVVDIMRSVAHELVHHRQNETGELDKTLKEKGKIEDIGDKIEDDANAIAGQLIKKFAKNTSQIIYEHREENKPRFEKFKKYIINRIFSFDDERTRFRILDIIFTKRIIIGKEYTYCNIFYELLEEEKHFDIRRLDSEIANIFFYFSHLPIIVIAWDISNKHSFLDTLGDEEIIYEHREKTKYTLDKFIVDIIARWKRNNTIALSELNYLSVRELFGNTQREEFLSKMTQAVFELAKEIDIDFDLRIPKGEVCDLFTIPKENDPHSVVDWILSKKAPHERTEQPEWSDYVFDAISKANIDMLQRYTKVNHITPDYLAYEFPDLCHDFCFDYAKATDEKKAMSVFLYVIKSLRRIFEGCKLSMTDVVFSINMKLSFMMKSKRFCDLLKWTIDDALSWIIDDGNSHDIKTTRELIDFMFIQLGDMTHNPMPQIFTEWAGGELPVLDVNRIESSIDEQRFNEMVTTTIIKFFDKRY